MAAIGTGWADGAWVAAGWVTEAWSDAAPALTYRAGLVQSFADTELDVFFADMAADDVSVWMGLEMGFAESVFVGSTELAGIFDNDSMTGATMDGPRVLMKTDDIDDNSIDQGTVLTIRSRTFHVAGVQRDGVGVSNVILHEPV